MIRTALSCLLASACLLAAPPELAWEHDLGAAQKRAKAENKLIFMDIWTGWCGWCIKLQKDTFPSAQGQAALAKVVPLSIKTQEKDGSPTALKSFEKLYPVQGFPAMFILDANGKVVAEQPGYLPPAQFAAWIDAVVAKNR